jgi:hypothetical protein
LKTDPPSLSLSLYLSISLSPLHAFGIWWRTMHTKKSCLDIITTNHHIISYHIISYHIILSVLFCYSRVKYAILIVAASSVVTEWILNKNINEICTIRNTDIAQYLKLPPVKLHCSMLAEDAVNAAIHDYQNKQKGIPQKKRHFSTKK